MEKRRVVVTGVGTVNPVGNKERSVSGKSLPLTAVPFPCTLPEK